MLFLADVVTVALSTQGNVPRKSEVVESAERFSVWGGSWKVVWLGLASPRCPLVGFAFARLGTFGSRAFGTMGEEIEESLLEEAVFWRRQLIAPIGSGKYDGRFCGITGGGWGGKSASGIRVSVIASPFSKRCGGWLFQVRRPWDRGCNSTLPGTVLHKRMSAYTLPPTSTWRGTTDSTKPYPDSDAEDCRQQD